MLLHDYKTWLINLIKLALLKISLKQIIITFYNIFFKSGLIINNINFTIIIS
jgi:hypothetical protein